MWKRAEGGPKAASQDAALELLMATSGREQGNVGGFQRMSDGVKVDDLASITFCVRVRVSIPHGSHQYLAVFYPRDERGQVKRRAGCKGGYGGRTRMAMLVPNFHWMAPPTSIPSKSSIMVSDATSRPFCACVVACTFFWLRESCTRSRLFPRQMPGLLDTDVRRKERRRGAHRITGSDSSCTSFSKDCRSAAAFGRA